MMALMTFPMSSRDWQKALVCWERASYEIQLSWTGPEELQQANYVLWSLPKGLRFLRVVPTSESPKGHGPYGYS